jgi:hypothetical protein
VTYLIEYFGEFKFIFETILDYESGDQMGSFDAKKTPSKISCLDTFKCLQKLTFFMVCFSLHTVSHLSFKRYLFSLFCQINPDAVVFIFAMILLLLYIFCACIPIYNGTFFIESTYFPSGTLCWSVHWWLSCELQSTALININKNTVRKLFVDMNRCGSKK